MRHIPSEVWAHRLPQEVKDIIDAACDEWCKEQEPTKSNRPGVKTEHVISLKRKENK